MKTYSGIGLLVLSLMILLSNMSETVAHFENWHDATTPQFVAALLKEMGATVTAAIGGSLMPQFGGSK
jgi:hypothetical protein